MSQFRFARLALMLAALGLNAAPVLMHSASAQDKNAPAAQPKPDAVRPELFKLLDPAQIKPLMDAKNYTEVQNRVTQAEAPASVEAFNRKAWPVLSETISSAQTSWQDCLTSCRNW